MREMVKVMLVFGFVSGFLLANAAWMVGSAYDWGGRSAMGFGLCLGFGVAAGAVALFCASDLDD